MAPMKGWRREGGRLRRVDLAVTTATTTAFQAPEPEPAPSPAPAPVTGAGPVALPGTAADDAGQDQAGDDQVSGVENEEREEEDENSNERRESPETGETGRSDQDERTTASAVDDNEDSDVHSGGQTIREDEELPGADEEDGIEDVDEGGRNSRVVSGSRQSVADEGSAVVSAGGKRPRHRHESPSPESSEDGARKRRKGKTPSMAPRGGKNPGRNRGGKRGRDRPEEGDGESTSAGEGERTADMLAQWEDVKQQLDLHTPSPAVVETFNEMDQLARHLAKIGIYPIPPEIAESTNVDEYPNVLKNAVYRQELDGKESEWQKLTDELGVEYSEKAKEMMLQSLASLKQEYEDGRFTRAPDALGEKLSVAWNYIEMSFLENEKASDRADGDDQSVVSSRLRFNDCKTAAIDIWNAAKVALFPLKVRGMTKSSNSAIAEFIADKMCTDLRQSVENAWDAAIEKAVGDPDAAKRLRKNKREALAILFRQGPWYPGSDKPDEAANQDFDSERSGIPGDWSWESALGVGGYGTVTLWVRKDANGSIIDRVAMKECYTNRAESNVTTFSSGSRDERVPREGGVDLWTEVECWHGNIDNRVPLEHETLHRINRLEESFNVVQARGYGVYDLKKMYRLYIEYCPHGDLQQMFHLYRTAPPLDNAGDEDNSAIQRGVPERVIWAVFEALASAVCLMHDGCVPGLALPENHLGMIHSDIKPNNVFLSEPDGEFWPGIPTFKLGDFGLCRINKEKLTRGMGTAIWMAPEAFPTWTGFDDNYADAADELLTGHTVDGELEPSEEGYMSPEYRRPLPRSGVDIWSVGRIIYFLMSLKVPHRYTWEHDGDGITVSDDVRELYSESLSEMVDWCLHKWPSDRPSAKDLWEDIHGIVATLKGLRGGADSIMKFQEPAPTDRILYQGRPSSRMVV